MGCKHSTCIIRLRIHIKLCKTFCNHISIFLTLEDVELNQRGQQYILVQNDLNKHRVTMTLLGAGRGVQSVFESRERNTADNLETVAPLARKCGPWYLVGW